MSNGTVIVQLADRSFYECTATDWIRADDGTLLVLTIDEADGGVRTEAEFVAGTWDMVAHGGSAN